MPTDHDRRIAEGMSFEEVRRALCGCNAGAGVALAMTLRDMADCPENMIYILSVLDRLGIYEDAIHLLFADICDGQVGTFVSLLVAADEGLADMSAERLLEAIRAVEIGRSSSHGIDLMAVLTAVVEDEKRRLAGG